MQTKTLGFIGGGRITRIILQSFKNKQVEFQSIVVCDTNTEVLDHLKKQFREIQITDSCLLAAHQDIVFLALHPPVIVDTLDRIHGTLKSDSTVISLAPKIDLQKLKDKLGIENIARMIPNATSYINEGFNPISFSTGFPGSRKKSILEILNFMGNTIEVEEQKLEAYAIISAMLPTYFWFQWDEMVKIGQQIGLNETESLKAVRETLEASLNLFFKSGLSYKEVIDLIPVKPIGEHEAQISDIYQTKLPGLFQKIKP